MNLRLKNLRKLLADQKLDAVLISSLPNITYLTNFSGFSTEDRDAYLLITKNNQYIFTHGIYKEAVTQHVTEFKLIDIQRENPLSTSLQTISKKEHLQKIGFEAFDLHVDEYERLQKRIGEKILQPADWVSKLRLKKHSDEIQMIKKACVLGDNAYSHILKNMRIKMTEKELSLVIEVFIKEHSANISFPPVVAFGPNASKPHHIPTDAKLKRNDLILLDFGVRLNNYCSDMTRTVIFGKATGKQKKVYETVLQSQQKAIDFLQKKITSKQTIIGKDIDAVARNVITSNDFPTIPHSLGHGIGLEVHEPPRLTILSEEQLANGMVFSIEPGIYLPGEFGVRIEDLFAIEDNKLIQLTNAPKTLIEM